MLSLKEPINGKEKEMSKRKSNWVYTVFSYKRKRKNWTTTDLVKLARMYRSGRLSIRQIANRLDRTYFAVIKKAGRMNLTFKKKK